MTTTGHLQALLEHLGDIDPFKVTADKDGVVVELNSCDDYLRLCETHKLKPGDPRWSNRDRYPHRTYDAITKDNGVVLAHRCWPHLACWADVTGERTLVEGEAS